MANDQTCDPSAEARARTELMSPAGHWPQLRAAVEAGADAVYFGLDQFSARAKVGFHVDEIPDVMKTLHGRGVRGYVTFNTLVFNDELRQAQRTIEALIDAGADALIVQDIGIADLVHQIAPDFPIHGSTQMSVTSAEGCEFARELGCSRVVMARELSLTDLRKIRAATKVELEVFVHGALCVSYSGQCFSSEAWGGRSANRGQCAQACRLSYELFVDGQPRPLGASRYLLSPGDLLAIEHVPQLVEIGISCLKIEGRYKDAEYVAMTTRAYRAALDAALQQRPHDCSRDIEDLEQIYSRGLGDYFISGVNHQRVVVGRAPRHRGVRIGRVVKTLRDSVIVETERSIDRGDGLVFDAADRRSPDQPEQGGFVYDVREDGENRLRLWFAREGVDLGDIAPGDWVWRTIDPKLEKHLKPLANPKAIVRTLPIQLEITATVGSLLSLDARLPDGRTVTVTSEGPLERAQKQPTDLATVEAQLGRLGGTPFHLGELRHNLADDVFIPTSVLNSVRRAVVDRLEICLANPPRARRKVLSGSCEDLIVSALELDQLGQTQGKAPAERIHVLVRTLQQLDAAIASGADSITLDYLELYGLRNSVERIRNAGIPVRVASPRVLKPSEQKVVHFLLSLKSDLLVRSAGLLWDLCQLTLAERPAMDVDFSLNIANLLSARRILQMGIRRITPTHDLNAAQTEQLAWGIERHVDLEVIALHHLPVFHMEHCVFCRFLSSGTDSTNCGHPCEKHRISVKDQQGRRHPIMADVGCRNTVFGAELQSAAPFLDRWRAAGISNFRLEFVHQSSDEVAMAITATREFLTGNLAMADLNRVWGRLAPSGTTEGSLFTPPLVPLGDSRKGSR